MTKNILILCHGMTLAKEVKNHDELYKTFSKTIFSQVSGLRSRFEKPCLIEYGHKTEDKLSKALKNHEKLLDAEIHIEKKISHKIVSEALTTANIPLPFPVNIAGDGSKRVLRFIRDDLFTHGLTDALYYASSDGESAIRNAIYTKVLDSLKEFKNDKDIRLHVVAHSLGATVMFDFLYGLFAPVENYCKNKDNNVPCDHEECQPDFYLENIDTDLKEYAELYKEFRKQAKIENSERNLSLASFSIFGGQLPFFFMRKQALVDKFANTEDNLLDASVIGMPDNGPVVWKIFYDANDPLGYPVKGLFKENTAIQEFHVNSSWKFWKSHDAYWDNKVVVKEIAKLLARTSRTDS